MVFDYVAGKLDWLANDLPIEGELADIAKLGDVADRNIPITQLSDRPNPLPGPSQLILRRFDPLLLRREHGAEHAWTAIHDLIDRLVWISCGVVV
jgi:hypothetical protein